MSYLTDHYTHFRPRLRGIEEVTNPTVDQLFDHTIKLTGKKPSLEEIEEKRKEDENA